MSIDSQKQQNSTIITSPELLKQAISEDQASEIASRVFTLQKQDDNPFRDFIKDWSNPIPNPLINMTSRYNLEQVDSEVVDIIDSIGIKLLGGFSTYNLVVYRPRAVLAPHRDNETEPNDILPVSILQIAGCSVYRDLEPIPHIDYILEPRDLLLTDGNRLHSARNTGDTDRLFACFS